MTADRFSQPHATPSRRDDATPSLPTARELDRIAQNLLIEDTPAMLDELVAAAAHTVPGAEGASIGLLNQHPHLTSSHSSDTLAALLDEIQAEVGEGPSLDAVFAERPVRVPDLPHEQRWPRFTYYARRSGAGSILSVPLGAGDRLGSLSLCSRQTHALDNKSEPIAPLIAAHAALAIVTARKTDQLRVAVANRDLIGQAKGILMERYGIDADQAFAVLVRGSQTEHRRLRDLAKGPSH